MERIEEYCYTKKDFKIDWFSGTGPGGQNRNKVQACVRITHVPSGLKTQCTSHRSRQANFREAFHKLGDLLKPWIMAQINKNMPQRQISTERVRTYHIADNWVLDHKSGLRISADELDKRFGDLIIARRKSVLDELLKDVSA